MLATQRIPAAGMGICSAASAAVGSDPLAGLRREKSRHANPCVAKIRPASVQVHAHGKPHPYAAGLHMARRGDRDVAGCAPPARVEEAMGFLLRLKVYVNFLE